MINDIVLSLWENRKRLHLMDVILNSNLLDYNFIGCSGLASLQKFILENNVDVIDIKTGSHLYSVDTKNISYVEDTADKYIIHLKEGKNICLL